MIRSFRFSNRVLFSQLLFLSFFVIFNITPLASHSSVYYVSASTGNDEHSPKEAQNPSTAWKTIDRVNSFFPSLTGGDSILFKRGEIFYGSIQVNKSGALFAPIYIGAYGKGTNPEISGFTSLRSWSMVRPGVYASNASLKGKNVVINGMHMPMGRYPNQGYLSYEAQSDNKSITDLQLTSTVNWIGGEVVIRKNRWTIDRSLISNHSGGTISYEAGNKTVPTKGYGYFIQNDIRTLDQVGEWFADEKDSKLYVYFGKNDPDKYHTRISTATNLVDIVDYNNIVFENLHFTGAGRNAFNILRSSNITLRNLEIDYSGTEAVLASYSPFLSIKGCIILNSWSGGINLDLGCTNALLSYNKISKVGLSAGMGKSGTGTYEGITAFGDFTSIEKNSIDSIGYNGIYFGGNASFAKNNFISYFCLTKDDGAAVYIGDWTKTLNKVVEGNIILKGIGNKAGTGSSGILQAEGIYIDDNSQSVKISNNTIFDCANNGIKIHNAKDILVSRNTVLNNGVQLRLEQDCYLSSSSLVRNNSIQANIFFSKGLQANASYSSHANDINDFGRIDSNYYNLAAIKSLAVHSNGSNVEKKHNIVSWTESTGNDKSSIEIQTGNILFEYNSGDVEKIVTLKNEYTDVYKKIYRKELVLAPYTSVVLLQIDPKAESSKVSKGTLVAKL